jgi:nitrile hydratase
MNGAHDLGGMHNFGPINPEPEAQEPVFHADWERRVFGMARVLGALGRWTGDMSRYARERQHPANYLQHSYYENWLAGLEKLLVESELITGGELASGVSGGLAAEDIRSRLPTAKDMARLLEGSPVAVAGVFPARFRPGDWVRAINRHPLGHTRQPRYVRGRAGLIHAYHGAHTFPDDSANGVRCVMPLYCVRFERRELWGDGANLKSAVYVDLWEDYLEPLP